MPMKYSTQSVSDDKSGLFKLALLQETIAFLLFKPTTWNIKSLRGRSGQGDKALPGATHWQLFQTLQPGKPKSQRRGQHGLTLYSIAGISKKWCFRKYQ